MSGIGNARSSVAAIMRFVLLDEMNAAETPYASESVAATLDEEQQYEKRWAATLVARALERLRKSLRTSGRPNSSAGRSHF